MFFPRILSLALSLGFALSQSVTTQIGVPIPTSAASAWHLDPAATIYPAYIPAAALASMSTKWGPTPGYSAFVGGLVSTMMAHVATQTHVTLSAGPPIASDWLKVQSELQVVAASFVATYTGLPAPVKMSVIRELQSIATMEGEDDALTDIATHTTTGKLAVSITATKTEEVTEAETETQASEVETETETEAEAATTKTTTKADSTTTIKNSTTETNTGAKATAMGVAVAAGIIAAAGML